MMYVTSGLKGREKEIIDPRPSAVYTSGRTDLEVAISIDFAFNFSEALAL